MSSLPGGSARLDVTPAVGEYRSQRATGIVLARYRAVYIPIPKVACTSLKTVFAGVLDLQGDVHRGMAWPEVRLDELVTNLDGLFVFAFVRNPWDRLLSCYRSKIDPARPDSAFYRDGVEINFWKYGDLFRGHMTFREFVRAAAAVPEEQADMHFSSQHVHVFDPNGHRLVDFLGHFESLAQDFVEVCATIGLEAPVLPCLHRTTRGRYEDDYDSDLAELVSRRWKRDIDVFGYRFSGA